MSDVLDQIAAIRDRVPAPNQNAVKDARETFLAETIEPPAGRRERQKPQWFSVRRALPVFGAAGVIAVTVLAFALLTTGPATHVATASYVERIATIAERQSRQIDALEPGQYLLTKSETVVTMRVDFTQAKLDTIAKRIADAASRSHFQRRYPDETTPGQVKAIEEREARRRAARSEGIALGSLPASSIEMTQRFNSVVWVDARHDTGDSVVPGEPVEFGAPRQKRAAEILRSAGIPDGTIELKQATGRSEEGRFEYFSWSSDQLGALPLDPEKLADRLRVESVPFPIVRDERPVRSDEELFHEAIGLLRSPFASPALRAATMRMIGEIPGVNVSPAGDDARGRRGLSFALTTVLPTPELVLNENDASVLGINYVLDRPSELNGEDWIVLSLAEHARLGISFEPAIVIDGEPICREIRSDGGSQERYCPSRIRPAGKPEGGG